MAENTKSNGTIAENDACIPTPEAESTEKLNASPTLNDVPQTPDEFEKGKQQFTSGNMEVCGNQAESLMIIQNAIIGQGISFKSQNIREVAGNSTVIGREYDLTVAQEFAEFGQKVKASEHFAVAIILCVFEYIELDDLQSLKSKLLMELPKLTDGEGKEIAIYQDAYIPINDLAKSVKAKMFITESGENCIGLGKQRQTALKNLWQQFPALRAPIARWLVNVSDSFEYRTNFDTLQITVAFVNIFKLDFNAGVTHFFQRFYSGSDKYWLLGFIALELYQDSNYRFKMLTYINKWAESNSLWLWKSALYVYANLKNEEESAALNEKIKKALIGHCNFGKDDNLCHQDIAYIGMLLINSERLRTLVASILGDLLVDASNYNQKRIICLWYLETLRYGYYLVSKKATALPLVACDKKQQLVKLLPLLEVVLSKYDTRKLLFAILEAYLEEISNYNVDQKTVNHIKAFFLLLAENRPQFYNDISLFLKKCNCKLAKKLEEFLSGNFYPAVPQIP